MASWTFPSERPPTTRESIYDVNELDWIHLNGVSDDDERVQRTTDMRADRILPTIVSSKTRLRPYLSDNAPIFGETMNWRVLCMCCQRCASKRVRHVRKDGTHESTEEHNVPSFRLYSWFVVEKGTNVRNKDESAR